jgi:predicted nucleic acid-binding protein
MILFFDSSALAKYLFQENNSDKVKALIDDRENTVMVSELLKVEVKCAFFRRFRNKEISSEQLKQMLVDFDVLYSSFKVVICGTSVFEEADSLVVKFGQSSGLRTIDALQLATFTSIADKDWHFVIADITMASVAKKLGKKVIWLE